MSVQIQSESDWKSLLAKAAGGDAEAQCDVAMHLEFGDRVSDSFAIKAGEEAAYEWYYRAWQGGDRYAVLRMAGYLSEGRFCEADRPRTLALYREAIAAGTTAAWANLAGYYREEGDYVSAFDCYRQEEVVEGGPPLRLGLHHYYGLGTPVDEEGALGIFEAISSGDSGANYAAAEEDEANFYLGLMHLKGQGTPVSIEEAVHYLRLANKDGDHPSAETLLWLIDKTIKDESGTQGAEDAAA